MVPPQRRMTSHESRRRHRRGEAVRRDLNATKLICGGLVGVRGCTSEDESTCRLLCSAGSLTRSFAGRSLRQRAHGRRTLDHSTTPGPVQGSRTYGVASEGTRGQP